MPKCRRCRKPALPGYTCCAKHCKEKTEETRALFSEIEKAQPPRCLGRTPDGKPCPAYAFPGRTHCGQHIREGVEAKPVEKIRAFTNDFRQSNPKLHNFYVRGAYEDLRLAREVIEALNSRSRVPAGAMAAALRQAMVAEIEQDAAFFEAAALLFAGLEPPKEEEP